MIRAGDVVFYKGHYRFVVADVTEVYTSVYGDLTARLVDQGSDEEFTVAVAWLVNRPDFDVVRKETT